MTDRDIHEAFERIKPDEAAKERMLENILSAAQPQKRVRRKGWKRSLLLAAALAAGLSVAAAAYGTDFFGLWSVGMRDREIYSPVEVEEGVYVPGTEVVDEVSMQGLMDSPEAQAAREYEAFCSAYDPDGAILAATDFFLPASMDYEAYTCYTQEMIDELDRLCEKYGLALLGPSTGAFEERELFDGVGTGNVCRGCRDVGRHYFTWGYYYAGGSYMFEGSFVWNDADGRSADYQFNCAAKGYLSTLFLNVGSLDDYEQWEYTTADGVSLLLALGPSKGLIFADTEKSFVTVNVLGDWPMGIFDLSREDLEDLAEGFDFTAVR